MAIMNRDETIIDALSCIKTGEMGVIKEQHDPFDTSNIENEHVKRWIEMKKSEYDVQSHRDIHLAEARDIKSADLDSFRERENEKLREMKQESNQYAHENIDINSLSQNDYEAMANITTSTVGFMSGQPGRGRSKMSLDEYANVMSAFKSMDAEKLKDLMIECMPVDVMKTTLIEGAKRGHDVPDVNVIEYGAQQIKDALYNREPRPDPTSISFQNDMAKAIKDVEFKNMDEINAELNVSKQMAAPEIHNEESKPTASAKYDRYTYAANSGSTYQTENESINKAFEGNGFDDFLI